MKRQNKKQPRKPTIEELANESTEAAQRIHDLVEALIAQMQQGDEPGEETFRQKFDSARDRLQQLLKGPNCHVCPSATRAKCPLACQQSMFCPKKTQPKEDEFLYFTPAIKEAFSLVSIN